MDTHISYTAKELVEHFFRHSYGKMVSMLVAYFGLAEVEKAEDIAQDTLVEAVQKWSVRGIPENPEGWLMDVAKKKMINLLRRDQLFQEKISQKWLEALHTETDTTDSSLRMIFACCHPDLAAASQIALSLKILCGLSVAEIAGSLLTSEENIQKRLYRAKKKFRVGEIPWGIPAEEDESRLSTVLKVLYLLFNEGYFSIRQKEHIRLDLCYESMRLLKQVLIAFPSLAEGKALMALMYLSVARFESRVTPLGELVLLKDQDRSSWDQELIGEGLQFLSEATETEQMSVYHLQAGIMAEHCMAKDIVSTNWESIHFQYELLNALQPSPIVQLNSTIALFYLGKKEEALVELDHLTHDPYLSQQALFFLTKGMLNQLAEKSEKARAMFNQALELSSSEAEREMITRSIDQALST